METMNTQEAKVVLEAALLTSEQPLSVAELRRLWVDPFRDPRMWTLEDLQALAAEGVKTIYMRRLLADFAQEDLNQYFNTGVMSEDREKYLTQLGTDPAGRFNDLELVKAARAQRIRVQALSFIRSTAPVPSSHGASAVVRGSRSLLMGISTLCFTPYFRYMRRACRRYRPARCAPPPTSRAPLARPLK